jgi:hypothetical protein
VEYKFKDRSFLRDKCIIVLLFSYFFVVMRDKTILKRAISHHLMRVGRTNLFRLGLKLRLGLVLLLGMGLFVACMEDSGDRVLEVPVVFSSGLPVMLPTAVGTRATRWGFT